jgi:hypothetical protein
MMKFLVFLTTNPTYDEGSLTSTEVRSSLKCGGLVGGCIGWVERYLKNLTVIKKRLTGLMFGLE